LELLVFGHQRLLTLNLVPLIDPGPGRDRKDKRRGHTDTDFQAGASFRRFFAASVLQDPGLVGLVLGATVVRPPLSESFGGCVEEVRVGRPRGDYFGLFIGYIRGSRLPDRLLPDRTGDWLGLVDHPCLAVGLGGRLAQRGGAIFLERSWRRQLGGRAGQ